MKYAHKPCFYRMKEEKMMEQTLFIALFESVDEEVRNEVLLSLIESQQPAESPD